MKKHLIIALLLFVLIAWGSFTFNTFDETPWEQNLFVGYSMLIGFFTEVPVIMLTSSLISGPKLVNNPNAFDLYFKLLPFIVGGLYALAYGMIVWLMKYFKKAPTIKLS